MHVLKGNADLMKVLGKEFFHIHIVNGKAKKCYLANDPPLVDLNIDAKEVQQCTGFCSIDSLLAHIFVVCNGEIVRIN